MTVTYSHSYTWTLGSTAENFAGAQTIDASFSGSIMYREVAAGEDCTITYLVGGSLSTSAGDDQAWVNVQLDGDGQHVVGVTASGGTAPTNLAETTTYSDSDCGDNTSGTYPRWRTDVAATPSTPLPVSQPVAFSDDHVDMSTLGGLPGAITTVQLSPTGVITDPCYGENLDWATYQALALIAEGNVLVLEITVKDHSIPPADRKPARILLRHFKEQLRWYGNLRDDAFDVLQECRARTGT